MVKISKVSVTMDISTKTYALRYVTLYLEKETLFFKKKGTRLILEKIFFLRIWLFSSETGTPLRTGYFIQWAGYPF